MSILLSNDDGIGAPGLVALREALEQLDEVWVVAPDRDQSAVSHSVTLYRPLRMDKVAPRTFAVDGTPTDCVNLAVNGILSERPRLIVSGINHGANLGDDVTYSGTVSAAMEGTLLGIPSIAMSLAVDDQRRPDFRPAASFARRLAATLLRNEIPADTLLNVNVPNLPEPEIKGFRPTKQGKRRYGAAVVEKVDPRGRKYYWIGGDKLDFVEEDGTDFSATRQGFISVTPLHLDLTNYQSLEELENLEIPWP